MSAEAKKALIIINMIIDYFDCDGPMYVPGIDAVIEPLKKKMEEARQSRIPIIYLCDCHDQDDSEFRFFPPHAIRGSRGACIIEEMKPEGTDIIVRKSSFSGFFDTVLDQTLKKLSVQKLMITGTATNISIQYTAVDALMRGYEVDIVKDAVTGPDLKYHQNALEQMQELFHINIV